MERNKRTRQRKDRSIFTQNRILSDTQKKREAKKGPVMTLVELIKNGYTDEEAIDILKKTYKTIADEWIITARHIVNQENSNTYNKDRTE